MDRHKFLAVLFMLLATVAGSGCDDNNNRQPGCIDLSDDTNALSEFAECPTDGLVQFCNSYGCNFYEGDLRTSPLALQSSVEFFDCIVVDCFNLECGVVGINGFPNADAVLSIEEILENSNIAGISSLDGAGEFTFECSPIVQ